MISRGRAPRSSTSSRAENVSRATSPGIQNAHTQSPTWTPRRPVAKPPNAANHQALRSPTVTLTLTSPCWQTWVIHPAADDLPSGPWIYVDARDGQVLRVERTGPAGRRLRLTAGVVVILMIALIVVLFAVSRVCNQQVLGSGSRAVYACRHLQATDPPMIAIGIVIVATSMEVVYEMATS